MLQYYACCLLAFLLFVPKTSAQEKKDEPKKSSFESRVLKALADGKVDAVTDLVKEVAALKEDDRTSLPFRLRGHSVEFRFQGECPGHTDYIEFIASNSNREYESLIVLNKAEFIRAREVLKVVTGLAKSKQLKNVSEKRFVGFQLHDPALEFNLLYMGKANAHSENLENILVKREGAYLSWEDDGIRLRGDRDINKSYVPSSKQAAVLILIVRPDFLHS
jgi:hypothetical protein